MAITFWWVTNIPTPYRNYSFERMRELFPRLGIDFRVLYMAWSEPRRSWKFSRDDLHYPAEVYRGIHPTLRGVPLHLNPGLLLDLHRAEVDAVMIGGYSSPTHALAPFAVHRRTATILGCETNLESEGRSSLAVRWIKHRLLASYDAFLVPQTRSREFVVSVAPETGVRPFIDFPNLIDPAVFRDGVARVRSQRDEIRGRLGVSKETQLWFCPARLAPEKGLGPFFESMRGVGGVRLLVAGEGPERTQLDARIRAQSLPVSLLGNVSQRKMVELYAAADLFVLPSLGDPSPLSTIEACAAGLPLLVSPRVGNFSDVLDEGHNGWGLSLDSHRDHELIQSIAALPANRLAELGLRSRERYEARFDTDRCVEQLADGVRQVVERKRAHFR